MLMTIEYLLLINVLYAVAMESCVFPMTLARLDRDINYGS